MTLRCDSARVSALVFLTAFTVFYAGSALATFGYFPHGFGAKNKAMAGAGMAMPEDAISIVNNPAVAAVIGNRMDVGLTVFIPRRNYTTYESDLNGEDGTFTIGPADIDSDDDLFLIPEIARNWQLKNNSAIGIAFYMRTGMKTKYKGGSVTFDPDGDGPASVATFDGTYGDGETRFEMSQAYLDVTWAKRWGGKTSFGISAVLAAQGLKVKGTGGLAKYTQTFAASDGAVLPDSLSNNGRDRTYGAGLKLGFHRQFGEHFSFGMMYQTEIKMGKSHRYSDLFANGAAMDIPAWFRAGITWQPTDRLSFSIDMQQIWYSKIDAIGNSFFNLYDCPTTGLGGTDLNSCLGGKNGPGFGWKDVPVYSFGASWDISDNWTLRAGMAISDQPVPADETTLNILFPSQTESHYAFGFTRKLNRGHELSFSFMYSEEESIERANQLDRSQTILLTTDQFDFEVSYSWGF